MSEKTSRKLSSNWTPDVAGWFLLDAGVAFAAMYAAYNLSPYINVTGVDSTAAHFGQTQASLLFGLLTAITGHIFGLHNLLLPRHFWPMLTRCAGAASLALGVFTFLVFAVLYNRIGRYILLQAWAYTPVLMALPRALVWRQSAQRKCRLLLLGAGQTGQNLKALIKRSGLPFKVIAFADFDPGRVGFQIGNNAVLDASAKLSQICVDLEIDELVNCLGHKLADHGMDELMDCMNLGVRVSDATLFVERNFFEVPVEQIRGEWFLQADLELAHPIYQMMKRTIDITTALCGLALLSPLLLVAAIAIRLESRGPVFYSQIRVGRFNTRFRIWKLRSMRTDAEKEGPQWAESEDGRITRIGFVLRRTRLDEVPQFWNILRGEMSLVGPRPERPEFVERLAEGIPFFNQRHLVKPGLTGWAQINYGYGACTEDSLNKLKYDLYYIKHASLGLDLQIILRTGGALMNGAR